MAFGGFGVGAKANPDIFHLIGVQPQDITGRSLPALYAGDYFGTLFYA